MKSKTFAVALGVVLLLSAAQRASAGYAVCIRIAVVAISSGWYGIKSCNPPWRCWCDPIDEENPLLGCATNFPSQVLYRVGCENGWFAARNLTYKTREKAIAAGCTTNNLGPTDVAIEEYLTVEESESADGPWKHFQIIHQSPDDIDLIVTNSIPKCFYRVVSTNSTPEGAPPEVHLMRPTDTTSNHNCNERISVRGCYCDPSYPGWFRSGPILTVGHRYTLKNNQTEAITVIIMPNSVQSLGSIAPGETREFTALGTSLLIQSYWLRGQQVNVVLERINDCKR